MSAPTKSILVVLDPCDALTPLELDLDVEEAQRRRDALISAMEAWLGRIAVVEQPELRSDFDISDVGEAFAEIRRCRPLGDAMFVATTSLQGVVGAQGLLHHLDENRRQDVVDELWRARQREGAARVVANFGLTAGRDRVFVTGCFRTPESDGDVDLIAGDFQELGFEVAIHASALFRPTDEELEIAESVRNDDLQYYRSPGI